jgi:hypothetical protein
LTEFPIANATVVPSGDFDKKIDRQDKLIKLIDYINLMRQAEKQALPIAWLTRSTRSDGRTISTQYLLIQVHSCPNIASRLQQMLYF